MNTFRPCRSRSAHMTAALTCSRHLDQEYVATQAHGRCRVDSCCLEGFSRAGFNKPEGHLNIPKRVPQNIRALQGRGYPTDDTAYGCSFDARGDADRYAEIHQQHSNAGTAGHMTKARRSPKADRPSVMVEPSLIPAPVLAQQVQVVVVAVHPSLAGCQPVMSLLAHEKGCGACMSQSINIRGNGWTELSCNHPPDRSSRAMPGGAQSRMTCAHAPDT